MKNSIFIIVAFICSLLFGCTTEEENKKSKSLYEILNDLEESKYQERIARKRKELDSNLDSVLVARYSTAFIKEYDNYSDNGWGYIADITVAYGILNTGNYDLSDYEDVGSNIVKSKLIKYSKEDRLNLLNKYLDAITPFYNNGITKEQKAIVDSSLVYARNYLVNYDSNKVLTRYESLDNKDLFIRLELDVEVGSPEKNEKELRSSFSAYRKIGAQIDRLILWHKVITKEELLYYLDIIEKRLNNIKN